jgi:hypothetical protein
MAEDNRYDPRRELMQVLLDKVAADTYPSVTMLDMIEDMLTPDDVEPYVEVLMDKIRDDNYPSIDLMSRVKELG